MHGVTSQERSLISHKKKTRKCRGLEVFTATKHDKISGDLLWNFGIEFGGHRGEGRDPVKSVKI
jgi:hypothetical protein